MFQVHFQRITIIITSTAEATAKVEAAQNEDSFQRIGKFSL